MENVRSNCINFLVVATLSLALCFSTFSAKPAQADVGDAVKALVILGGICAATGGCGGKRKVVRGGGGTTKRIINRGGGDAIAMNAQERRLIQEGLTVLGFYSGKIDGAIGKGSRKAIRAYQESIGEKKTGYLSASQMNAVAASAPVFAGLAPDSPAIFAADLARDLDKEELRALQTALNEAGFSAGSPDGSLGPNTRSAISAYKAANLLAGKSVPTKRLLAFATNGDFALIGGGQSLDVGPEALADETQLAGGAHMELELAEPVVLTDSVEIPAEEEAILEKFAILQMETGMSQSEIEEIGVRVLGEGVRVDTARLTANAVYPRLDLGHLMVQQTWPQIGSQAFVSYYSSENLDLGAIAIVRMVSVGNDATLDDFERETLPLLAETYGTSARVRETLTWVGDTSARERAATDAKRLAACGRVVLDPVKLASASSTTLGWSAEVAPTFAPDASLSVTEKCGEVLHVTFGGALLQMSAWNSDALESVVTPADSAILPAIKF